MQYVERILVTDSYILYIYQNKKSQHTIGLINQDLPTKMQPAAFYIDDLCLQPQNI